MLPVLAVLPQLQAALADILAPLGLSPRSLKAEGRYAEDSY